MKTIIVSLLGLGALSFLTNCTLVESREPSTRTTRTTTTEVTPTTYGTVETKTTRSY
jgi:hypothetical protein